MNFRRLSGHTSGALLRGGFPTSLLLAALCLAFVAPSARAQGTPEIRVGLEAQQIYLGESVVYEVSLHNASDFTPPKLGEIEGCRIESLGEQSLNQTSITIVNGQMARVERKGRAYRYRLTPLEAGELSIPAPSAEADGKLLRGRSLSLRVVGPEPQDVVVLEIEVDARVVFPRVPFDVALRIFVKALPGGNEDRNPLTVQNDPPALSLPWVESPPSGVVPEQDWRDWLAPLERQRSLFGGSGGGITINSIASFFTELSTYMPESRQVRRAEASGREVLYWEYTLKRRFRAESAGIVHFGPASLKGAFGTRIEEGRLVGERIYALAEAVEVEVREPPIEGRPDSFTGAVGHFGLSAEIKPSEARVGDPLTLVLRLSGEGTLDLTRAPDLERIPEVAAHFKVYEATEETHGSSRVFTWGLRATDALVEAFPPIPLSYFDVEQERYVTLKTEPLPLEIGEAEVLSEDEILLGARRKGEGQGSIEASREGLFGNLSDPSELRDDAFFADPRLVSAVLGGLLGSYLLARLLGALIVRRFGDPAQLRRRTAAKRARRRLREGLAEIARGEPRAGTERVRAAFAGIVADVTGASDESITQRDARERLEALGLDGRLVEGVVSVFELCDAARYGVARDAVSEKARAAEEQLGRLLRALKSGGHLR